MTPETKGRFRHPLRNEWERVEQQFTAMAKGRDRAGAMARVMLDVMPAFLSALERERDFGTAPLWLFDAIASASGMMIENVIEQHPTAPPRAALQRMLIQIERIVGPRVASPKASIILPEGFGK